MNTMTWDIRPDQDVDNTASITYNYYYDELSRLTGADQDGGANDYLYEYDDTGNITRHYENSDIAYYFDSDNRATLLNNGSSETISYDQNGNMTSISNGEEYNYDAKNRLTKYEEGGTSIIYNYYPDGTRASRQVSGSDEVKFVYDKEDVLVEYETNEQGDIYSRRYTHGPGIDNPAKLHLEQGAMDKDFAYHLDALGSVRLLSDSSKDTAVSYTYLPYGESTLTSGTDADAEENRYRFTAREFEQAHFTYYRSRYYANRMGRFLTKDIYQGSQESPVSQNRFLYTQGNTVNLFDPFGFGQGSHDIWHTNTWCIMAKDMAPMCSISPYCMNAVLIGCACNNASQCIGIYECANGFRFVDYECMNFGRTYGNYCAMYSDQALCAQRYYDLILMMGEYSWNDDLMHCYFTCLISSNCGIYPYDALAIGAFRECKTFWNNFWGEDFSSAWSEFWNDSYFDNLANSEGASCYLLGNRGELECLTCCEKALGINYDDLYNNAYWMAPSLMGVDDHSITLNQISLYQYSLCNGCF